MFYHSLLSPLPIVLCLLIYFFWFIFLIFRDKNIRFFIYAKIFYFEIMPKKIILFVSNVRRINLVCTKKRKDNKLLKFQALRAIKLAYRISKLGMI